MMFITLYTIFILSGILSHLLRKLANV